MGQRIAFCQGTIAGLPTADDIYRVIAVFGGQLFTDQQNCCRPIGYGGTVKKAHRPGDPRVAARVSQEFLFTLPGRDRFALRRCFALFTLIDILDAGTEMGFVVQRAVFVVLDADLVKGRCGRMVLVHVGSGHGCIKTGESEPGRDLELGVGSRSQGFGHLVDRQVGHLFDSAHQHHIVYTSRNGHEGLAQCHTAAGTGILHPQRGDGCQANPAGQDRCHMGLSFELVTAEIAHVESLDLAGIQPPVNGCFHILVCFNKQVTGRFVRESPKLAHPGAYHRYTAGKFFLCHTYPLPYTWLLI